MSIKKSNYTIEQISMDILKTKLNNLLNDSCIKNIPEEIRQKIDDLKTQITNCQSKVEDHAIPITGQLATQEQVLSMIMKATGYKKWKLETQLKLNKKQIDYMKKAYAVSFFEKEIYEYVFNRETDNRDETSGITIIVLPGYFEIYMESDRAEVQLEDLLTNEEALIKIKQEF